MTQFIKQWQQALIDLGFYSGSVDGVFSEAVRDASFNAVGEPIPVEPPPPPVVGFRYLHLFVDASETVYRPHIKEVKWSPDGGVTIYPQSIGLMTSDQSPAPLRVWADTVRAPAVAAYHCYDDSKDNYSCATNTKTAWIVLDLGEGNEIIPNWIWLNCSYKIPIGAAYGSDTHEFDGPKTLLHSWTGVDTKTFTQTW